MSHFNWLMIIGLCGLLLSQQAMAQRYPPRDGAFRDKSAEIKKRNGSLDRAVSRIRKRTGARILSAETREVEGRRMHVIRVLTREGKVRRLRVDADSEYPGGKGRR